MKIRTTAHFDRRVAKRVKKSPGLKPKIKKQIELLKKNPKHPSLKLHKLHGKRAEEMSFWIEGDLRITFSKVDGTVLFTDIITHDEY